MSPKFSARLLTGIAVVLITATLTAKAAPRFGRAQVTTLIGKADYLLQGRDWKPMRRGTVLTEGASSRTGTNSVAEMALTTAAQIRITQNTIIRFDQLREQTEGLPQAGQPRHGVTSLELERGKVLVRAKAPTEKSSFAVTTRSCLSEVRGFGAYSVYLMNNRACVRVLDQTVTVLIRGRSDPVVLQAGQQLCVE
ncbi:MAG: FecR domain-containing protein, partial [Verrucomicrobiae bacterium]|nr:FecR domain-containing protein [Verrucomicrobiae bacterium]